MLSDNQGCELVDDDLILLLRHNPTFTCFGVPEVGKDFSQNWELDIQCVSIEFFTNVIFPNNQLLQQ